MKASLKISAVLIAMTLMLIACGGGSEPAKAPDGRTTATGNAPVFETPPTPGQKP